MKGWRLYWLCLLGLPFVAQSHGLDSYLQATQISLFPDHVVIEIQLVPGVLVAEQIFRQMDTDNDGQLSSAEGQIYVRQVLKAVTLEVNHRPQPLRLVVFQLATKQDMDEGRGANRLELTAHFTHMANQRRQLFYRNQYQPRMSSYLVNVLFPLADGLTITQQRRDTLQQGLTLEYTVAPPTASHSTIGLGIISLLIGIGLAALVGYGFRMKNLLR